MGLEDYKLGTLAKYFEIAQREAHRAEDDARACGEIYIKLLEKKEAAHKAKLEELTPLERETCEWIKSVLVEADENTQLLTFRAATYLTVNCIYTVVKLKLRAKRPYALIRADAILPSEMETAPATKSEGENMLRVFYNNPSELNPIKNIILDEYRRIFPDAERYFTENERRVKAIAQDLEAAICV